MKSRTACILAVLGLTMLLTACLTEPLLVQGEAPTPVDVVELLPTTAVPTPTVASATTAEPLPTPSAPHTPTPMPTPLPATAVPVPAPPHLITRGETAVRTGPGLAYDLSHFLGPGTTAPILGRHVDGGWWAIHGPGDGPGPHSWVADSDVTVQGDTANVPIFAAPALPPTPVSGHDVPLVGETGVPPAERYIISHPGMAGPINVHLGPGAQFALIARLDVNRWAEGIQEQV